RPRVHAPVARTGTLPRGRRRAGVRQRPPAPARPGLGPGGDVRADSRSDPQSVGRAGRKPDASRTVMDLPDVDERRCTGCGDCVPACPTGCLAMAGSLPWLARPADCVSCALCALVCPTSAIAMKEEGD